MSEINCMPPPKGPGTTWRCFFYMGFHLVPLLWVVLFVDYLRWRVESGLLRTGTRGDRG